MLDEEGKKVMLEAVGGEGEVPRGSVKWVWDDEKKKGRVELLGTGRVAKEV